MARNIKGIVIEIDGNTTGLDKALSGVNKNIREANTELRDLNKMLKLDPGNTDLLAQKQQVLGNTIKDTSEKLSKLKSEQENVNRAFANQEIDEKTYRDFNKEIIETTRKLDNLQNELQETAKKANGVKFEGIINGLKEVGKKAGEVALGIGKIAAKAVAVAGTALTAIIGKSIKMAGDLEQQMGGAEAVFGKYSKAAINASKTAATQMGVTSNEYLQTLNKMGSLMQGSGMSVEKSLDLSQKAMQRAADVASVMGISTEEAMNSIAGAAKGNFTMMDNLGVAMNATTIEAYALSKGITTSYANMDNATKTGLAMEMFLEKTTHAMGNYVKENDTFAGSLNTLKANFDNFLSGAGDVKPVIDSIMGFTKILIKQLKEMTPAIVKGLAELGVALVEALPEILQQLIAVLMENMPMIIEAGIMMIDSLIMGIEANLPAIVQATITIIMMITNSLIKQLPAILRIGIVLIVELIKGIAKQLPELIPAMIDAVILIVETLLDNIDLIISAGFQLMIGLIKGIVKSMPKLVAKGPDIIAALFDAIVSGLGEFLKIGQHIVEGIWNGISDGFEWIKKKIKGWVGDILTFFKKLLGIASPSRVMADQVGMNIGLGVADGIDESIGDVEEAMGRLNKGVTTSINPTINPQANSNPLILNIENFNNERQTDVQSLMEEAEFYRKNSAIATGGK